MDMEQSRKIKYSKEVIYKPKYRYASFLAFCFSGLVFAASLYSTQNTKAQSIYSKEKKVIITIRTEFGMIKAELYPDQAPHTVSNFLKYVDQDHFDGGSFFRTVRDDNQPDSPVKIDVIQAGPHPWFQFFDLEPITLERTSKTGIRHVKGAISMARGEPDTATSSFFICVADEPELDFGGKRNPDGQGFAAFGKVIDGMDVVRKIHQSEINGQAIKIPVRILNISY
jgi:peptidyl-prolyl cis-trans isomerase A (cyclophilin A)